MAQDQGRSQIFVNVIQPRICASEGSDQIWDQDSNRNSQAKTFTTVAITVHSNSIAPSISLIVEQENKTRQLPHTGYELAQDCVNASLFPLIFLLLQCPEKKLFY